MSEQLTKGRVTIPTDVDVVPQTLELLERWGADAIRDCDGTDSPAPQRFSSSKVSGTTSTSVGIVTRPVFNCSDMSSSLLKLAAVALEGFVVNQKGG